MWLEHGRKRARKDVTQDWQAEVGARAKDEVAQLCKVDQSTVNLSALLRSNVLSPSDFVPERNKLTHFERLVSKWPTRRVRPGRGNGRKKPRARHEHVSSSVGQPRRRD